MLELPPAPPARRVAYGEHPSQFADLYLPPGAAPHPAVVLVHGGYWRAAYGLEHMSHLASALAATRGIAAWSVEYRRLGQAGGGWPGTFLDVAAATEQLRNVAEVDITRVAAAGFSAGGHLALWLAGRSRIDPASPLFEPAPLPLIAAVALAPIADLGRGSETGLSNGVVDELLGGRPSRQPTGRTADDAELEARLRAASPAELLPLGVRQLLIHGRDDAIVPIEQSRRYRDRAGDEVTLIELPATGHFELIDPRLAQGQRVLDQLQGTFNPN